MPSVMKQIPIARTTGTLKIPPVNTPAPYSSNHDGAITVKLRTVHKS